MEHYCNFYHKWNTFEDSKQAHILFMTLFGRLAGRQGDRLAKSSFRKISNAFENSKLSNCHSSTTSLLKQQQQRKFIFIWLQRSREKFDIE